jgi:hypothetical protein
MNKIDLIIDALESAYEDKAGWCDKVNEALYAARELKSELAKPNDFYPDWDMLKPYHERIAELEAQLTKPDMPTKIFGPNLEQILNVAGFYRREWVGLTDEEIKEVLDLNVAPWSLSGVALQHVMDDARALEAKLKEKNT